MVLDYPPGCKRIAKSELYLEALCKPNVIVIPSGVDQIKGRTIIDKHGNETEVDILILATGFDIQGFAGNLQSRLLLHTSSYIYLYTFDKTRGKKQFILPIYYFWKFLIMTIKI